MEPGPCVDRLPTKVVIFYRQLQLCLGIKTTVLWNDPSTYDAVAGW